MADTMAEWVKHLLPTNTPMPVKYDLKTGAALEMKGVPFGDWRPAFDSSLIMHNGVKNHTLTLVLKIFYNQLLGQSIPRNLSMHYIEAGTPPRMYIMRPWQPGPWAEFLRGVKREAQKWNNKFYLIPPAGFSMLDVKVGSRTIRPNVYCHLHLEIMQNMANAYHKIDVLNLDQQDMALQLGVREKQLNSGDSRSNAAQYDSLDTKNRIQTTTTESGAVVEAKNYSTIVHELGHSIGLDHISVTHQDPVCMMAILLDQMKPAGTTLPALFNGGVNGNACYGAFGKAVRGGNVMGGGTAFDESNAAPWAQRLALHTNTKPEAWTVSMRPVDPKPV